MVFLDKNSEKKIYQVLNNVIGLNKFNSNLICQKFGFQKTCILKNLDSFDLEQLKNYLNNNYVLDKLLIEQMNKNVKNKINLSIYQGKRHNLGYPVRGQRTLSNGRTQRNLYKFRFHYDSKLFAHIFFKNQRKSVKNKKITKLKAKKKANEKKNNYRPKVFKKTNNNQIQKQSLNEGKNKVDKKKLYLIKLNKIKDERKKQVDNRFDKEHKAAKNNHPYFLNIMKGKSKKKKQ